MIGGYLFSNRIESINLVTDGSNHQSSTLQPQINTDITTKQVAINYVVAKGGVPLVEVNSPTQAEDVLGCLGWSLNDEEVGLLESAADLCK